MAFELCQPSHLAGKVVRNKSPTNKSHPDFGCGELHECEVFGVYFWKRAKPRKCLELVEELLGKE